MNPVSELDQTIWESHWVKDHPVYCPIPWCTANKLRHSVCGDVDGDYIGIHVARIKRAAHVPPPPELAITLGRVRQDGIDMGLLKGRRGRRKAVRI